MAPQETGGPEETIRVSEPIILALSDPWVIGVETPENWTRGQIVVGVKEVTFGIEKEFIAGLGFRDEQGEMVFDGICFRDFNPVKLAMALKVLENATRYRSLVANREEAMAAFYLVKEGFLESSADKRDMEIFTELGSEIQNHARAISCEVLSQNRIFSTFDTITDEIVRAAEERGIPFDQSVIREAQEKDWLTDAWDVPWPPQVPEGIEIVQRLRDGSSRPLPLDRVPIRARGNIVFGIEYVEQNMGKQPHCCSTLSFTRRDKDGRKEHINYSVRAKRP